MSQFIKKLLRYIRGYADYIYDWHKFSRLQRNSDKNRFPLTLSNRMPMILDKSKQTQFDAHYIYHNAWAIRTVLKIRPDVHLDISSTLYFCSTLSAFLPVKFFASIKYRKEQKIVFKYKK